LPCGGNIFYYGTSNEICKERDMAAQSIYQFYAELEGYKPKIWRRFQVANNITVARLGYIVMTMYEMKASHLLSVEHERYLLTPGGKRSSRTESICRYDIPGSDLFEMGDDATKTKLSQLNFENLSYLLVWYDFGDDWRVQVTLEIIFNDSGLSAKELPRVLDGKGVGIVEDSGGMWGLAELAKAFKAKKGEEYEQLREWLGVDDLDMAAFDIDDMNFRLKKIPCIYAKIYEQKSYPSKASIDLIERKYLKK
jgi:hypothetical protein